MAKTTTQTLTWHHIRSKKDLPEVGKRVLLKLKGSYGHQKKSYDYGYLIGIGITDAARKRMKPCERKKTITSEDQYGNNLVPWRFHGTGPMKYWGQDVKAWAEI